MNVSEEVSSLVKSLCGENGEKIEKFGGISITSLVSKNDITTVKNILDVFPNYINYQRKNRLGEPESGSLISYSRSPEMFKMLYDMGANLEIKDPIGNTPIQIIRNNLERNVNGCLDTVEKIYEEIIKEQFKQKVLEVLKEYNLV